MEPTWFDVKYQQKMQVISAAECMMLIGQDNRLVEAVREALAKHNPTRPGPSRTQVIRTAIVFALEAR